MKVAGIDVSSFAVDIVFVPLDDGCPEWHRFEMDGPDAFDRTRQVGHVVPGRGSGFWDDVLAIGIEEPAGRNPGFAFRVQGAVLSQIPAHKLVEKWMPSQWRKAAGLKGNATKVDVLDFVWDHIGSAVRRSIFFSNDWPDVLDRCDAYCIALATRAAIDHLPKERHAAA